MDYKLFLRDILKNNDTKSLKQYNDMTERLVRKDKIFNKYLLKNNQKIIKQYGGGTRVRVTYGLKTNVYNVHSYNPETNKEKYIVNGQNKGVNKDKKILIVCQNLFNMNAYVENEEENYHYLNKLFNHLGIGNIESVKDNAYYCDNVSNKKKKIESFDGQLFIGKFPEVIPLNIKFNYIIFYDCKYLFNEPTLFKAIDDHLTIMGCVSIGKGVLYTTQLAAKLMELFNKKYKVIMNDEVESRPKTSDNKRNIILQKIK